MRGQNYLQQLKSWQESLINLQHENAMLKIKLSELVDNSVMSDFLQKAESLHAELISNDESLTVLLDSVNHLSAAISSEKKMDLPKAKVKVSQISSDIHKYRKRFTMLSGRFQKEFFVA